MRRSQNKIVESETFLDIVKDWQKKGNVIVFTNGCFDILHPGHIDLLEKAREQGDKLVIGLNTDNSVSRIKGDLRPINDEKFRSTMIAALECVDLVTLFDEDTPMNLIMNTRPEVLVKGSDYNVEEIVGSRYVLDYGGQVKAISLLPGFSTTKLIEKIKEKTKTNNI